jgi:hypothetical protein
MSTQMRAQQEDLLLDDLEASTKRIYQQSLGLKEEAVQHVGILDKVERDMDKTTAQLRAEALHAETMKKANTGVCWMYSIILMEVVLLVFLLYIGLSNQYSR